MHGHGFSCSRLHGGRVALAHIHPFFDGPADRQIAVDRVVGRGLIGHRVRTNAPPDHLRQDFGGVAEQPDRDGCFGGPEDFERLVQVRRPPVEIAGLEPLLDPALLAFDRQAMRARHHRRQRLGAAHPAEARGQDPAALEVAAIMLAAHLGEGLVGALDDALGADVDPRAGRHLAVHHQPLAIELVEMLPGRPFRHQVGIGDQHPRRVRMGAEDPDRLARLDEQGLVVLEPLQSLDDPVEARPVPRRPADAAVDDQLLRRLGDRRDRDCSGASAPRLRSPRIWRRGRARCGRGSSGCCRGGKAWGVSRPRCGSELPRPSEGWGPRAKVRRHPRGPSLRWDDGHASTPATIRRSGPGWPIQ